MSAFEQRAWCAVLLVTSALTPFQVVADEKKNQADVVATFGGVELNLAELDALARDRLARVRNDEYQIRRQVLEAHISKVLLEKEAAARKLSVDQLQKAEIDDKVVPVTAEQKQAVYDSQRERYAGMGQVQAFAQIETTLRQLRLGEARKTFMESLRSKAGVRVLLEAPRLVITDAEAPDKGPKNAPITIVEFSDFQCPYCSRALAAVKQVEAKYKGRVRIVFRHFPLQMHKDAAKAAEAGVCAFEQGKFWEMHDAMFANQAGLQVEGLKKQAADVGLDAQKFASCLESGRGQAVVRRDMSDGGRYGVTGTPAFFINGRMLSGARSYEEFVQVIEDELRPGMPPASESR